MTTPIALTRAAGVLYLLLAGVAFFGLWLLPPSKSTPQEAQVLMM